MAMKWPEKVLHRSFVKGHSFQNSLYVRTVSQTNTETRIDVAMMQGLFFTGVTDSHNFSSQ